MAKVPKKRGRPQVIPDWVAQSPELIVSDESTKRKIARALSAGLIRRLAPQIYTKNLTTEASQLIRRHLWEIIGRLVPEAVLAYRTAFEAGPTPGGEVWVTWRRARTIPLPGHRIHCIRGAGPQPSDMRYVGGLYFPSEARQLLENLGRARTTTAGTRAVPRAAIESRLEQILQNRGEGGINQLRDLARALAPVLKRTQEMDMLDGIIGTLLGTLDAPLEASTAKARARGRPFDTGVVARLDLLFHHLQTTLFPTHPDPVREGPGWDHLAFFDAYFSNYIEGTTFEVAEAEGIVFEGRIVPRRTEDSHDILGTYRVVADPDEMRRGILTYGDVDAFLGHLRERHRTILAGREGSRPGEFKVVPNRAGETVFVLPELVIGTLAAGYERGRALATPFARAVFTMALVTEVHPFIDGNGRVARAFLNAELIAGEERRILIPSVYRDDYLGALRGFTRRQEVALLPRVLERAQAFTAAIDFTDRPRATRMLTELNAFREPDEARLGIPGEGRN